jgi:hypothetical protein
MHPLKLGTVTAIVPHRGAAVRDLISARSVSGSEGLTQEQKFADVKGAFNAVYVGGH